MRGRGRMHVGLLILALANMLPVVEVEDSWIIGAIALGSAVLSFGWAKPNGGTRIPRALLYAGVFASVGNLIYEVGFPHEEQTVYILALGRFILLLGCCKLFELRGYRDVALVLLICFLLVVIAAFTCVSPLFGAAIALDITLGVGWLMSFQIAREQDALAERRKAALGMFWERYLRKESTGAGAPGDRHARMTAFYSLALTAIAFGLFVGVPRGLGQSIFGRFHQVLPTAVTGFSDEVQLNDKAIVEDEAVVMRVHFMHNGMIIKCPSGQPYLRGGTFDHYSRGGWQQTRKAPRAMAKQASLEVLHLAERSAAYTDRDLVDVQVWLESIGTGRLFAAYAPVWFSSSQIDHLQVDQSDWTLTTEDRPRGSFRYCASIPIRATPETTRMLGARPVRRLRPADVAAVDPEVRGLGRQLLSRWGDPTDPDQRAYIAKKTCDYLRGGEFAYTLNRERVPRGVDPLKDFLFDHKQGHCEFFASAMAVLCQSAGIPARLINGYCGGEFIEDQQFYLFRQKDAHAWVEVLLPDRGWTAFDPSPPGEARSRASDSGLLVMSQRWRRFLQLKWLTMVVSFDADSRLQLVEGFENWVHHLTQTEEGETKTFGGALRTFFWGPELLALWQRLFYWLLLALSLAFVVLTLRAMWIASLLIRELLPAGRRRASRLVRKAEARFYDRLLLLLANKGHRKPVTQTPREFAADMAASIADFSILPELAEWFYEAQYGGRNLAANERDRLNQFLHRLREDASFGLR